MRSTPSDGEHEKPGHFLVAPEPSRPGPGLPRDNPGDAARAAHQLAALVLAGDAARAAIDVTRSADREVNRVRVEARAGRRRLWHVLLVVAAVALAALVLYAARHHPGGFP